MKKALALVLALVLALSMGVSAFATDLVVLDKVTAETEDPEIIVVAPFNDEKGEYVLYTRPIRTEDDANLGSSFVTYIALDETKDYTDIKLTANGNLDAELVEYDPDKMVVAGELDITYCVTMNGKTPVAGSVYVVLDEDGDLTSFGEAYIEARDATYDEEEDTYGLPAFASYTDEETGDVYVGIPVTGLSYDYACAVKAFVDAWTETDSVYGIKCEKNVNIIKLTVENNFTAHYTKGTLKIEAKLGTKSYSKTLTLINDVAIFEYEQVKYAAKNNASGAYLQLGGAGYSDFFTSEYGYSFGFGDDYDYEDLRDKDLDALVVSTTAFRAIEGEDLTVAIIPAVKEHDFDGDKDIDLQLTVTLKDIVKGQKGINFFAWADYTFNDKDDDDKKDANEAFETISFGFKGNQVVNGEFEVDLEFPISYYNLREAFGKKVEEEDIITYYVLKNGKAFDSFTVDYMTDDVNKNVELTIKGENEELGWYTLALEVPAEETEVEENPNTGAESVVGVVAALAVVSVATAAAVSLKK